MQTLARLDAWCAAHPELRELFVTCRRCFDPGFFEVLDAYNSWRAARRSALTFLDHQLAARGIARWWPRYPPRIIERLLQEGTVLLWVNDDTTIATALAQLVVDGKIAARIRSKALVCVTRQLLRPVPQQRNCANPQAVQGCLTQVRGLLQLH